MSDEAGARSGVAPAGDAPGGTERASLLSYIDGLPPFGKREAYLWKEGVRWRRRTYAELHRRILGCAAALTASGLQSGDHVLIQGPDSPDWVEALLGTLQAGGVVVPLEPAASMDLRAKVGRIVGARVLIGPRGLEPPPETRLIEMGSWAGTDATLAASGAGVTERGAIAPGPGDRAEVIFTSGTTGEPKGVVLTHGNLISDLAPIERGFRKREHLVRPFGSLRFISTLPLSHMFGQTMNVFLSLTMGFTVVLVPPRPREVMEAARRKRAWGLFTVPRLLDLLAMEVRRSLHERGALVAFEARQKRLAGRPFYLQALVSWRVQRMFGWRFRLVVAGGAALPEEVLRFWRDTGYLVIQGYGLTEAAPIVSLSNPFDRQGASVGRPMRAMEVRLGPGNEVLIRGPNVTSGYLGTGEKPREDGWFHTGDIGEIDAGGHLRIRGRLKDVIVTSEGENVHAVDVEAAFEGLPGVRVACVIGLAVAGGDHVHAVLLMEKDSDPAAAVERANERLMPKQRVRGHTVWPEPDFPRTAIGKVRKGLVSERVLALQRARSPGAVTATTGVGGVRRIVAEVAQVDPASLRESTRLVEGLGFGSLDLVELSVALEEEFGAGIPEDRLAGATVGDLEAIVLESSARVTTMEARPAAGGPGGGPPAGPSGIGAAGVEGAGIGDAATERGAARRMLRVPRWVRWPPVRALRRAFQEIVIVPFVRLFARPEVRGLAHLTGVAPPYLLVANHQSFMDSGLFLAMLPRGLRGCIVPGMTTRYHPVFFRDAHGSPGQRLVEWFQVRLVQFFFHAWPLPETGAVRESLAYAGELADAGYSPLIFPEGRHVPEGSSAPFRGGIGIFARELRLPVVPVLVEGTARVLPEGVYWPRFGRTRLILGPPLWIDHDADPAEATRLIEAAVRRLVPPVRERGGVIESDP
jgi:long-chain acyl-CoA synthetase